MSEFITVAPEAVNDNVIKLIGKDWTLITAGGEGCYNTMTASWGGMGVLWSEPVAFIFIRPQRYTFGFAEQNPMFTLSFFDEQYRSALRFCGTRSGRDVDKAKQTGLTPVFDNGITYFDEARLVMVCEKLYAQDISEACFIDKSIIGKNYPTNDFHRMYIGKIVKCLQKA